MRHKSPRSPKKGVMGPSDDDEAGLLRGSPEEFGRFYLRNEDIVLAFFLRRTHSAELAADLMAETFARALQGRRSYDQARGDARGWLFGIAKHLLSESVSRGRVQDVARRRLQLERLSIDDEALARIDELTGDETITQALGQLPEDQRLALVGLLLSATIALAATGVIEFGSPVRPERPPRPAAGVGAPLRSRVRLLPLRAPDPAGGLPWGMRIVPTTRGDVCLQIGRVEHRQLGVLGVDGAFHDDGRFHPLSVAALPIHSYAGSGSSYDTLCQLAGAHDVSTTPYARSAGRVPSKDVRSFPRRDLRTVSYGLLGPKAVSVAYREGKRLRTERVTRGLGAYLVVQRSAPGKHVEPPGVGGGVTGSGEIIAKKPLTAIVYRVAGRLCDRALGHMHENGCSSPHALPPQQAPRKRDLHERLHTRLLVSSCPLHSSIHVGEDRWWSRPSMRAGSVPPRGTNWTRR